MPPLRPTLLLAAAQLLHTDLLAISPTDAKLSCQNAKAFCSCLIGFQNPSAQIIRNGLCHLLRFAEIAESNVTRVKNAGYSYFGSALERFQVSGIVPAGKPRACNSVPQAPSVMIRPSASHSCRRLMQSPVGVPAVPRIAALFRSGFPSLSLVQAYKTPWHGTARHKVPVDQFCFPSINNTAARAAYPSCQPMQRTDEPEYPSLIPLRRVPEMLHADRASGSGRMCYATRIFRLQRPNRPFPLTERRLANLPDSQS